MIIANDIVVLGTFRVISHSKPIIEILNGLIIIFPNILRGSSFYRLLMGWDIVSDSWIYLYLWGICIIN